MAKKYHQGKYKLLNPQKYKGDANSIVYRSSYELVAFRYLDMHPNVVEWASEEIVIPYISPIDGRQHRYFTDLYFKLDMGDGTTKRFIAEIKPFKYTQPPKEPKRKTKSYVDEVKNWAINNAKWDAAKEVCADNNIEFILLTENELGIK